MLCLLVQLLSVTAGAVRYDQVPHPAVHCVCGAGVHDHRSMNGHADYEEVWFTKNGVQDSNVALNAIWTDQDFSQINLAAMNNKGKTFYYYLADDVTIKKPMYVWDN